MEHQRKYQKRYQPRPSRGGLVILRRVTLGLAAALLATFSAIYAMALLDALPGYPARYSVLMAGDVCILMGMALSLVLAALPR